MVIIHRLLFALRGFPVCTKYNKSISYQKYLVPVSKTLCSIAGDLGSIPGQGTRSHMQLLRPSAVKYINIFQKYLAPGLTHSVCSTRHHGLIYWNSPKLCTNFLKMYLFLIGGKLLNNIVWVSAIHQHESAIGIHFSPPSRTSFPSATPIHPSTLSRSTAFITKLLSQFVPPSSSFTVSASLFSTSVFPLLPCKWVHQCRLSRFHIYVLIY